MFGMSLAKGVTVNCTAYIFGGLGDAGSEITTIQKFVPYRGVSSKGFNMGTGTYASVAGTVPGWTNSVHVFGGQNSGTVYNTIKQCSETAFSNTAYTLSGNLRDMSCTSLNTSIYLFGGGISVPSNSTAIVKFTGTARTNETATLGEGNAGGCAATLGSNAWSLGGWTGSQVAVGTAFKWDGTTATTYASTVWANYWISCAALEGKIYRFKGGPGSNVESWDGTTRSTLASTVLSYVYATSSIATTIDNNIYITGGQLGGTQNGDNESTNSDSTIIRFNAVVSAVDSSRLTADTGMHCVGNMYYA